MTMTIFSIDFDTSRQSRMPFHITPAAHIAAAHARPRHFIDDIFRLIDAAPLRTWLHCFTLTGKRQADFADGAHAMPPPHVA